MHDICAPYKSNVPEPNFTERGCDGSLDIVVIPIVLVFPEFLLVYVQRSSEDGRVWIFATKKWTFWVPRNWTDFHGPPLMNNTTKVCFGEDLVKIRQAIAESCQKKKNRMAVRISDVTFACSKWRHLKRDLHSLHSQAHREADDCFDGPQMFAWPQNFCCTLLCIAWPVPIPSWGVPVSVLHSCIVSKRTNIFPNFFSPFGRHTILVFLPYQTISLHLRNDTNSATVTVEFQ